MLRNDGQPDDIWAQDEDEDDGVNGLIENIDVIFDRILDILDPIFNDQQK